MDANITDDDGVDWGDSCVLMMTGSTGEIRVYWYRIVLEETARLGGVELFTGEFSSMKSYFLVFIGV